MPDWLEDASANRHIKTYVKDFLDISGNLTVRSNDEYKWNTYGQVLSGRYESDNNVQFGISTHMDASGTTIVVGGHNDNTGADQNGAVYVYRYDTTAEIWYQLGNTIGSPTTTASTSSFGRVVQISANGNRIAVLNDQQEDLYLYDYDSVSKTWDSAGSILSGDHGLSDVRTDPGFHLSGDGNTIMFSDHVDNSNTGKVLVYRNNTGTTWTKIGEFTGSSDVRGSGNAISYDGNRICFGEPYYDYDSTGAALTNVGRATIYDYTGTPLSWTQVGDWIYSDIEEDYFGITGDMTGDGSIVLLSGLGGGGTGSVRVYQYDANVDGSWNQLGSTITGIESNSWGRGARISDDGATLVAGHQYYDDEALEQGALYVYKYINGDWEQQGEVITGTYNNITWNDKLGYMHTYAINGDGTKIVGGVISADLNTTDSGAVQAFQWSKKALYNPALDISGGVVTMWSGAEENPNNYSVTNVTTFSDGTDNYGINMKFNADGTIMVVGESNYNSNAGRIHAYKYRNGIWSKMGSDIADSNITYQGFSLGINDSGLIIGSGGDNGNVIVWEFINGDWSVKGGTISNSNITKFAVRGLSFNDEGNIVAGKGDDGAAIYQYNSGTDSWDQLGSDFTGLSTDGRNEIDLNQAGNIVAIGDPGYDSPSTDAGRVGIFQYNSGTDNWDQLGDWITAPSTTSGGNGDHYGSTVSLSSDGYIVAFGTTIGNGATADYHARIFQYIPSVGQWTPRSPDVQNDNVVTSAGSGVTVGHRVALSGDGNTLVVNDRDAQTVSGVYSGAVHVLKYIDGAYKWVTRLDGPSSNAFLGAHAVAISRDGTRFGGSKGDTDIARIGTLVNRPALKIEKDLVRFGGNTFIPNILSLGTDGSTHYAPIENVPLHLHRTPITRTAVPSMKVYRLECTGEIDDDFGIRIEYKIERRKVANLAEVNGYAAYTDVITNNVPGTSERGRWFKRLRNDDATVSLELRYNGYTYPQTGRSSTSDDRLKKNETLITNASETIMKLSPQLYEKYNNFDCSGDFMMESGLVAQDIWYNTPELRHLVVFPDDRTNYDIQPLPEGVNTMHDIQNDPDYTSLGWGTKPVHILYSGLIPYLIKSNQEQQEILDTEKAKTELVESEIATMEPEVATLTTQMADLLSRISVLENK